MDNKRESGFYWVCNIDLHPAWAVAEYSARNDDWFLIGDERPYYDHDFDEIDETPIVRGSRNA